MKAYSTFASLLIAAAATSPSFAHFVWVSVEKDSSGQPAAHVWFSELAEPDSADLLDKIAAVKVASRQPGQKPQDIKLAKHIEGNGGWWTGAIPAGTQALSAHINYGVLERRGEKFLLQYHAKYLDASAAALKALARDEGLPLDIVPQRNDKGFTLEVLFQGQPAAGAEIGIFDPVADQIDGKTDDKGRMQLTAAKPGLYSIRAKWVVTEAGKLGDKEYPQVHHYCTLALRVLPPGIGRPGNASTTDISAAELINKARAARAVWQDFPGIEAKLTLFAEDREQTGRVKIAADGEVTLSGFELKDEKTITSRLRSLAAHRLPGGELDDRVSFADDQTAHPLGRLIKLDYDSSMASAYRINGDVIREVNRHTDGGRFTISIFEVNRNPEGKYLPGFYTVSFWNKDGSLRSSNTVRETWIRVGSYDLPATHEAVFAGTDEHRNVSMKFSDHKLLK